ncbi:MAG: endolytic transglycosylase MltG [Desulfofustis sp.]|nr:endolytic transglycosylase MltG [Desulfofustis sp.]
MVKGLVLAVLTGLVCLVAAGGWLLSYGLRPGPPAAEPTAVVLIERGSSVAEIGNQLAAAGLINDDPRFVLLTRIMGLSAQLPAGEFQLATGRRPVDLVRELAAARPLQHHITLQEGLNLVEIADRFAAGGWIDRDRFLELAHDPQLLEELGLSGLASLEGYPFPDTYSLVRPGPNERELLTRLVGRALAIWDQLAAGGQEIERHDVFTLASIVEKETGQAQERPLVAGVFLNRLARGMRLQSDPTVVYGLADFSGRLSREDLRTPTPYNTYLISGLPPGPICSPGEASLQAVLKPAETDFLYFVAKNDGTHHFSRNLREHNRAVRIYQRGR